MLISVLIAVYNAEHYLRECLDSLRRQTFPHFEALCVDDASTDGSWSLLNSYAQLDSRFKVFSQPTNQGQARARNLALRHAQGDLVCMLDSDDFLADDALQRAASVFSLHPLTDCVLFRLVYYHAPSTFTPYNCYTFQQLTGRQAFLLSLSWKIHGLYVIRASIHRRIPYDDRLPAYSDDNTTRKHYLASREVRTCSGRYFYRQHPESVTHAPSARRFLHLEAAFLLKKDLAEHSRETGDVEAAQCYEPTLWLVLIDTYDFFFHHRRMLTEQERAKALQLMKTVWESTQTEWLPKGLRKKIGYAHLSFWRLFCWQEEAYFTLRDVYYRMLPRKAEGKKRTDD